MAGKDSAPRTLPRDQSWPQAAGYMVGHCSDPNCGLHIVACDENEKVLTELVFSLDQLRQLGEDCMRRVMRGETGQ